MKIAIASGKGGTGKTTLSTNLATFLGENHRVVLVDLDVEEPNSKLFIPSETLSTHDTFKMIPQWIASKCIQCAQCVEVCNYNALIHIAQEILIFPNLCHSCYACSELCPTLALPMEPQKMGELTHWQSSLMDGVEGRLAIGEEQAVSLISQTKKYVEKYFAEDTIKIYDAPPGTSCPMVEAVKDVAYVILVTEPTPFGLHDLRLAVATLRVLEKEFGVVINQFGIGNDAVFTYCEEEHIDIIAKIPHDKDVAMAYARGALAYQSVVGFKKALGDVVHFCEQKGLV